MAKRLRCTFEMEIDVEFENPEAAAAYFLSGEWPTVFYKLHDLNEVAETLAWAFFQCDDEWDSEAKSWCRATEAFGRFHMIKDTPSVFQTSDEAAAEIGSHIRVQIESELENTSTAEVEI